MYIADLHIHSRFSRATSRDCDLPHLDWWARRKGIQLIGTGDFTHPAWRAEMREQLVPAGEGVYALREGLTMEGTAPGAAPRFVVTGEISCIYKRHGRTRKVHNLILLPSLEAAEELSVRLEAIGNIHSDGRPILGLDSRDLLELTLETCPEAEFIPAHIWTPHFAMFGAFSGFDTVEECFGDLADQIHGVETGLSSDPVSYTHLSRTAASAMTPWWEWVRLMPSSFRRSASTTTMPFSRAAEAMCPRVGSVSPFMRKILSMATPARRASVTALRPSMTPSFSASTGAERRSGGRLFMEQSSHPSFQFA